MNIEIIKAVQLYLRDTGSVPDNCNKIRYHNKASHTSSCFSVCVKVMLILYCSPLSMQ